MVFQSPNNNFFFIYSFSQKKIVINHLGNHQFFFHLSYHFTFHSKKRTVSYKINDTFNSTYTSIIYSSHDWRYFSRAQQEEGIFEKKKKNFQKNLNWKKKHPILLEIPINVFMILPVQQKYNGRFQILSRKFFLFCFVLYLI